MPKLYDIVPEIGLNEAIAAKLVKRQVHPTEPLAILNYTQKCQFDHVWTPITRACRGLIYRTDTLEVVARPFVKFFNYGQAEAGEFAHRLGDRVRVTDKADGSLGILHKLPVSGGWAIATRGSFTSPQAVHATEVFNTRYARDFESTVDMNDLTLLFEIIFPQNRIVLNYGDTDDLLFLTAMWNTSGRTCAFVPAVFKAVEVFTYAPTLAHALAIPPRKNAEGLVIRFIDTDERVKIKQADYVALHRVLTGTSSRKVWEFLAVNACKAHIVNGKYAKIGLDDTRAAEILAVGDNWLEAMLAGTPDEFFEWLRGEMVKIQAGVDKTRASIYRIYEAIPKVETTKEGRKQFAELVNSTKNSQFCILGGELQPLSPSDAAPALFALLDGRQIETYLWKQAYPAADKGGWLKVSEDVA